MTNKRIMPDTDKDRPDRTKRLNVPLTPDEKEQIRMEAAREGKQMAPYVRDKLFGEDPKAVPA